MRYEYMHACKIDLIRWRFDRFLIWTKLVFMCDLWKGGLRWLLGGGDGPLLSTGMVSSMCQSIDLSFRQSTVMFAQLCYS